MMQQWLNSEKLYDLTVSITPETVVFPGDPVFESKKLMDVTQGDAFTLCHFGFGNHTGTHIDFPAHVLPGGKDSDAYPLKYLMGKCKVVEVSHKGHVTVEDVVNAEIEPNDMVFFKTENSRRRLHEASGYTDDFAALEPVAAQTLVNKKAKLVGIDYLSIDPIEEEALPAHKTLLSNEVLVVENLKLQSVPAGEYFVVIAPLKVAKADGLPVRVLAAKSVGLS